MNSGALKYQSGQEKERLKTRINKKSRFARVPSAALTAEEQQLIKVTLEARDEWIETCTYFDYVYEEMLIDYYTYRIKASEARYAYFIKLVKEKGLSHYI